MRLLTELQFCPTSSKKNRLLFTKRRFFDIVKDRSTVMFILRDQSNDKKASKKRPIWRQLEDDRARLSYLYASMIEYKLDSGADIRSSDTPDEISRKYTENIAEGELFSYYSSRRYCEAAPVAAHRISYCHV